MLSPDHARMLASQDPGAHPRLACLENTTIVASAPAIQQRTGDLSSAEVEWLTSALSLAPSEDYRPAPIEWVESELLRGRRLSQRTLEAALLKLKERNMGRRAAELVEVMISAGLASKRALYYALAPAHKAGLYLQTAPLIRTLTMEYAVKSGPTKRIIQ